MCWPTRCLFGSQPRQPCSTPFPYTTLFRSRNDAFLARRQREVGILRREDVVHREQDLAVAADCEALHRRDPELLEGLLFGRTVGRGEPAVNLVDETQVADQIPQKADLPLIEMREVDAGAEQT